LRGNKKVVYQDLSVQVNILNVKPTPCCVTQVKNHKLELKIASALEDYNFFSQKLKLFCNLKVKQFNPWKRLKIGFKVEKKVLEKKTFLQLLVISFAILKNKYRFNFCKKVKILHRTNMKQAAGEK
jgi:hypothetical protein